MSASIIIYAPVKPDSDEEYWLIGRVILSEELITSSKYRPMIPKFINKLQKLFAGSMKTSVVDDEVIDDLHFDFDFRPGAPPFVRTITDDKFKELEDSSRSSDEAIRGLALKIAKGIIDKIDETQEELKNLEIQKELENLKNKLKPKILQEKRQIAGPMDVVEPEAL